MRVIIDSREQLPLSFKVAGNVSNVVVRALPFGDYLCEYEDGCEMPIWFERKSIADLYGTLTNADGIRRHKIKIEKAQAVGVQLYLIIDGTLKEVLQGTKFSKVDPQAIVRSIFTFKVKYGLQPIFCQSPEEMVDYMLESWYAWGKNFESPLASQTKKDKMRIKK